MLVKLYSPNSFPLLQMTPLILPTSRGTKVGDMQTLGPERYTAELCMVTKVIDVSETTV